MPDKYFSVFLPLPLFTYIPIEYFFRTCLSLFRDLHFLCKFIAESYSKKAESSFEGTNNSFLCVGIYVNHIVIANYFKECSLLWHFIQFSFVLCAFELNLSYMISIWGKSVYRIFLWILYSIYKLSDVLFWYDLNVEMKRFYRNNLYMEQPCYSTWKNLKIIQRKFIFLWRKLNIMIQFSIFKLIPHS